VKLAAAIAVLQLCRDTILDPFAGTGTTSAAAGLWGPNSIGVEVNPDYLSMAVGRVTTALRNFRGALLREKEHIR
jgi:DNA modification methylase